MERIKKTEKYLLAKAASDRARELQGSGIDAIYYRGHRGYIVEYWVQTEE